MQLYAYDRNGQLTFSCNAEKQKNYCCTECGTLLRLREGPFRQPHFYHLKQQRACRQNGKSETHLQIQLHLKNKIPEVILEHRFPNINRIADVFWLSEKIIFEIQCSPMTREEMQARSNDYKSLGLQTVWLLHDSRYNQWRLSAMEDGLNSSPHYYTNIDETGRGLIYDQWQHIEKGIRKDSLAPLTVDLSQPYLNSTLGFFGDIGSLKEGHPYLQKISEKEVLIKKAKKKLVFRNAIAALKEFLENAYKTLLKSYCESDY